MLGAICVFLFFLLAQDGNLVWCQECKDKSEKCGALKEEGECEAHKEWMLQSCPKSCDLCNQTSSVYAVKERVYEKEEKVCIDDHEMCLYWSTYGHCTQDNRVISQLCPLSCKLCPSSFDGSSRGSQPQPPISNLIDSYGRGPTTPPPFTLYRTTGSFGGPSGGPPGPGAYQPGPVIDPTRGPDSGRGSGGDPPPFLGGRGGRLTGPPPPGGYQGGRGGTPVQNQTQAGGRAPDTTDLLRVISGSGFLPGPTGNPPTSPTDSRATSDGSQGGRRSNAGSSNGETTTSSGSPTDLLRVIAGGGGPLPRPPDQAGGQAEVDRLIAPPNGGPLPPRGSSNNQGYSGPGGPPDSSGRGRGTGISTNSIGGPQPPRAGNLVQEYSAGRPLPGRGREVDTSASVSGNQVYSEQGEEAGIILPPSGPSSVRKSNGGRRRERNRLKDYQEREEEEDPERRKNGVSSLAKRRLPEAAKAHTESHEGIILPPIAQLSTKISRIVTEERGRGGRRGGQEISRSREEEFVFIQPPGTPPPFPFPGTRPRSPKSPEIIQLEQIARGRTTVELGEWGEWSRWSECVIGRQFRRRLCLGGQTKVCRGTKLRHKLCQ